MALVSPRLATLTAALVGAWSAPSAASRAAAEGALHDLLAHYPGRTPDQNWGATPQMRAAEAARISALEAVLRGADAQIRASLAAPTSLLLRRRATAALYELAAYATRDPAVDRTAILAEIAEGRWRLSLEETLSEPRRVLEALLELAPPVVFARTAAAAAAGELPEPLRRVASAVAPAVPWLALAVGLGVVVLVAGRR